MHWWENDGYGNFTEKTIATYSKATSVHVADMNNDSILDILGTNYGAGKIYWWENDGNQNFTQNELAFASAHWVRAVDMDNDLDMDIVGSSCGSSVIWWENDGSQNFTPYTISTSFYCAAQICTADIDNDGDIDLIASAEQSNQIAWWENDGNQYFTKHPVSGYFQGASGVYAVDMDDDDDIDLLGAARAGNKISYWKNDLYTGLGYNLIGNDFENPLQVYPNPAFETISVQLFIQVDFPVVIEFYNIYGKLLKTLSIKSNNNEIDISDLQAGVYFISVFNENNTQIAKFVKH